MRVATEMDFEIQPTDTFDAVADTVTDALNKIRTVSDEASLKLKIFIDVEFDNA